MTWNFTKRPQIFFQSVQNDHVYLAQQNLEVIHNLVYIDGFLTESILPQSLLDGDTTTLLDPAVVDEIREGCM